MTGDRPQGNPKDGRFQRQRRSERMIQVSNWQATYWID